MLTLIGSRLLNRSYKRKAARVLLAVALLTGCSGDATGPGSRSRHDWFTDLAEEAGLHFVYFNDMAGSYYFPEMLPGGVGVLDYDNDGDLDVYLVQVQMLGERKTLSNAGAQPASLPHGCRLYMKNQQE